MVTGTGDRVCLLSRTELVSTAQLAVQKSAEGRKKEIIVRKTAFISNIFLFFDTFFINIYVYKLLLIINLLSLKLCRYKVVQRGLLILFFLVPLMEVNARNIKSCNFEVIYYLEVFYHSADAIQGVSVSVSASYLNYNQYHEVIHV